MLKKIASLSALLVIFSLSIGAIYNILSFKYGDGILGLEYLYEQDDDTVDVLVLGSSHAFEDVNTSVLYERYGISSYILAGSVQPFWNSYYYLQEALQKQRPQMVVLEGYAATLNFDYSDHSKIIKNNLGIRDVPARIESIIVSSPADKTDDYIFSYRLWHSRYREISESDFKDYYEKPKLKYYKGFGINFATTSFETPDVRNYQGMTDINKKEEEYLRKIIELCRQQEIPLIIVVSPYALTETEQSKYNYLESIALEYQISFINYNSEAAYSRMGLDFNSDMADRDHLNYLGNIKYTNVLGEDIQNYMPLSDHRGDARYSSWEMNSKDIHARTADFKAASATTGDDLASAFDGSVHSIYVYTISDTGRICENTDVFGKLGIESGLMKDGGLYLIKNLLCRQISDQGLQWEYEESFDGKWLSVKNGLLVEDSRIVDKKSLVFNGKQYIDDPQGIYLFIYDNFTKELVGVKQMRMNGDGDVEVLNK
ncbi:MAG: hypothetical protein K2O59_16320 [Lachnospiraceae bacterium]|nr:hypothetical protein [Lachnospiraceae bacterium]